MSPEQFTKLKRGETINRKQKSGSITPTRPSLNFLREIVLDPARDMPLHAQLRSALERLIEEHFENGGRFYSESELISNLRVSQGTVRRSLADLAQRGLLEKRQARCTTVRKSAQGHELRNIAVFLPDFSSPSIADVLGYLNAECLNRGIRIQTIYTHRGEGLLRAYNSLGFSSNEGGVVLLENSPRATSELSMALTEKGYDHVVFGTGIGRASHKYVGGSDEAMIRIGLRHLMDLGHRRISLLVNEPTEKESVEARIRAFESRASASGSELEMKVVHSGAQLWEDAYQAALGAMDIAMRAEVAPTAIFAISDPGALAAIKWLQQRGMRVPGDVSVIGIGGIPVGAMIHPMLTTLADPLEEMSRATFELLTERNPEVRRREFEPHLIVRESTAPPPV